MPMGQVQIPIRNSTRIQDITPKLFMDAEACVKQLTSYTAITVRKCPSANPKKDPRGTWARSEIIEERWSQEDLKKQIKKLGERRRKSVADKKTALAPNQQGQIDALADSLVNTERDTAFEWTLVQLDSVTRPINLKGGKKLKETVTMTAYFKRAPKKDSDPVLMYRNIEAQKMNRARPAQPQQQPPHPGPHNGPPPGPGGGGGDGGGGGGIQIVKMSGKPPKGPGRSKSRGGDKYHEHGDSSTSDSYSDEDSLLSYGSDSLDTSISSRSRGHHGRHSHSKEAFRSHSKHRGSPRRYFLEQGRPHSPEVVHYDAYGVADRPFVPDVPRMIPVVSPPPPPPQHDAVAAAYQAGKLDAEAERYGSAVTRPIERVIERVIEPRPVISYGRMDRYAEPHFVDERYVGEALREEEYIRRRAREAEDYIDGRLDGVGVGVGVVEGRRLGEYYDHRYEHRRPSDPVEWNRRSPFGPAPPPLTRRYTSISSGSGW